MTNPGIDLLKELIIIDRDAEQPIYLQITKAIIREIRRGHIRRGLKLPASRQLADLLNINRLTVVSAYDELKAQGWIETIPRKGTFIKQNLPDITPQKISEKNEIDQFPGKTVFPIDDSRVVDFPQKTYRAPNKIIIDDGFPDIRHVPIESLTRNMRSISKKPIFKKYLGYGSPLGTDKLRKALVTHLRDTRGLPLSIKNIMITSGAQMAISIAAKLVIKPEDDIIVGQPGYFGANRGFQQQGAELNTVPVDGNGIVVDAVEQLCKKKDIKLLYVIPHHHNPTTVTLTPERRIRLLELAVKYQFAIVEDDYDYDFHYSSSPMLPMASLDQHGSVIYIGTLAKTLAPGIRIGFIVGVENFIASASNLRRTIDFQGYSLLQVAIANLYKDGTIDRHIKKSVKLYHKRRDHFCHLLEKELGDFVSFAVPDGGMAVWVKFQQTNLELLSKAANKMGLVINGKKYNTNTKNDSAIRMGFASLNIEEQEKAVNILSKCLQNN